MNLLSDILTYIRRIIKTPSNAVISDNLLTDYVNRFWLMDVDARIQLFDLKTKYQFMTTPGVDRYNMPLYSVQTAPTGSGQTIGLFPVYQGFLDPVYVNGVRVSFQTQKPSYYDFYPNIVQNMTVVATGDGTAGPYTLTFPIGPGNQGNPLNPPLNGIIRGHVDNTGIMGINASPAVDPPIATNTSQMTTLLSQIPTTSIDSAVFITATDTDGSNIILQDSGIFLTNNKNYGFLIQPGNAPFGHQIATNGYTNSFAITAITQATQAVITATTNFLAGQTIDITGVLGMTELNNNTYTVVSVTATTVTINVDSTGFAAYIAGGTISSLSNIVNYFTGVATNVIFPKSIPSGANISVQCYYFQSGLPRTILFYNNVLTLRSPPAYPYLVELDAYLSPAAFLTTGQAVPFGYMSEYIARGAARKILSDTGDAEQLAFYEPLFREQEMLVWKRSQRQWTATRTQTIYGQGSGQGGSNFTNNGGGLY